MTERSVEPQVIAGGSLLVRYVNFVKLPHTVFALPFAFLGVVYASRTSPVTIRKVLLILGAFTAARFAAMGFNRIVDRGFDLLNPRTRDRELPAGRLTLAQGIAAVSLAAMAFVACAGLLNRVCLVLSPVALVWILTYSFTKRFTHWSHLWLGGALAIAPVGGYLAIAGTWSTPVWALLAITVAVVTWVAGFDMFYALQDESFDREHGLKSAVVLLGRSRSIITAKLLHGITLIGLVGFGFGADFGVVYFVGVAIAALILAWEHRLVRPGDLSRLNAAFFQMNGVMSLVVFTFALGDRLL